MSPEIKLNLGCGRRKLPGFVNLDKTEGWLFQDGLPQYAGGSVDAVTMSHTLMYLDISEVKKSMEEVRRVLKTGGIVRITEDDTENPLSDTYQKRPKQNHPRQWGRGARCFTGPKMMRGILEETGFEVYDVDEVTTHFRDNSLMQNFHGGRPRCFFTEGIKSGIRTKKVCLDLHDFSAVNNRLELLLQLKEHFPGFKVSLFAVASDIEADWGQFCIRNENLKKIRDCLDWIQIIPHGLTHSKELERCDYRAFKDEIMPAITAAFDKDGLPFEKGFCAPHWRWSEGVVRALDEAGWWGAVDRNQPNMLSTKKFFRWSHSLHEPYHESGADVLKLHGHVYGLHNDLEKCLGDLMKLPQSVEWHFAADFLEEVQRN